jgi:hypothetical protein
VFFTPNEYVVGVTTFFQCVSSIKLNAKEDEWHGTMETLQEGKRKAKKVAKKGLKKKKWSSLWMTIHQCLQIEWKLK